ncbi:MAG: hypothetical protein KA098_04680 [Phenylobacterium sp.]|nr:hypothetical protein [Phenylobacterium sp.]
MPKASKTQRPAAKGLDDAFDQALADLPRIFANQVFERKLREASLDPDPALIEALTAHVLAGGGDDIDLDHPSWPEGFVLRITPEDLERFRADTQRFLDDGLPKLIRDEIHGSARRILRRLKARWPEQHAQETDAQAGFRERLETRWSAGITPLWMLLTLSREAGRDRWDKHRKSRAKKNRTRKDVLFWLHARACQVTGEVLVLLENGYADGAMARWRTLHEISVVAALIHMHGDDLAQRYLAHEVVDARAALRTHHAHFEELGYKPPSKQRTAKVERLHAAAVREYGPGFAREFGWAAKHVQPCNSFADLAKAAGRGRLKPFYKLASWSIHAGTKGLTDGLSAMGQRRLLAGSSNAGLTEPCQNTAITLSAITVLLVDEPFTAEAGVVLHLVREEAVMGFVRAGRRLRREEAARTAK